LGGYWPSRVQPRHGVGLARPCGMRHGQPACVGMGPSGAYSPSKALAPGDGPAGRGPRCDQARGRRVREGVGVIQESLTGRGQHIDRKTRVGSLPRRCVPSLWCSMAGRSMRCLERRRCRHAWLSGGLARRRGGAWDSAVERGIGSGCAGMSSERGVTGWVLTLGRCHHRDETWGVTAALPVMGWPSKCWAEEAVAGQWHLCGGGGRARSVAPLQLAEGHPRRATRGWSSIAVWVADVGHRTGSGA